jgi:hypothetical protein
LLRKKEERKGEREGQRKEGRKEWIEYKWQEDRKKGIEEERVSTITKNN